MFISCLFGFIFGLKLGTTEMPWGFGDFPTEEMKGRGNSRSLWMVVLWALTKGSGVDKLFWYVKNYFTLKFPTICKKNSLYVVHQGFSVHLENRTLTTYYLPTEFLINGIISGLSTVVNVICIFITAIKTSIIVLKIKEVAAPYTSSPNLR
ncbi:CLUMA_CG006607, isoform A, partial [Clunio marinus]